MLDDVLFLMTSSVATTSGLLSLVDGKSFQLFDPDDGFLRHVNSEPDLVAGFESLEQRCRFDSISHCHWLHEVFYLAMFDHQLIGVRHGRNNLSLSDRGFLSTR